VSSPLAIPVTVAADLPESLPLEEHDLALLRGVDQSLAESMAIKAWYAQKAADQSFARPFNLIRSFNRPASGTGFFDTVSLPAENLEVMGVQQEMLYDRADTGAKSILPSIRDELREFIVQYFMRISDFRPPEAAVETDPLAPPDSSPLSWCSRNEPNWQGFGYSQLYYKLKDSGRMGKFVEKSRTQIIDLRELGRTFEWIVMKVRLLDFNMTFRPFGPKLPAISVPLNEQTYLILHKDFIVDSDGPSQSYFGEYGFGYGLLRIKDDRQSLLAYGPGHFQAGFQTINFRMLDDGQTSVKAVFVVNRPERLMNFPLDPVELGFAVADLAFMGTASRLFSPMKYFLQTFTPSLGFFDPILTYVSAANLLTGGQAGQQLCISKEQLEKEMLIQHFMQHYDMIVGSLLTWRQIPDWLDTPNLPLWVRYGKQP